MRVFFGGFCFSCMSSVNQATQVRLLNRSFAWLTHTAIISYDRGKVNRIEKKHVFFAKNVHGVVTVRSGLPPPRGKDRTDRKRFRTLRGCVGFRVHSKKADPSGRSYARRTIGYTPPENREVRPYDQSRSPTCFRGNRSREYTTLPVCYHSDDGKILTSRGDEWYFHRFFGFSP